MAKGSAGRAGAKAAEVLRSGGKKPAKVINENRRYADTREPFTGRPAGRGNADINNPIDPNDTSPIEIEGEGGRRALIYRAVPTGKGPVGYVVKMIEPDGRVSLRKTDTFAPAQELALKYGAAEDATGAPEAPRQRRPEEPEAAAPDEAPEMYAEGVISHSGNGMKAELSPVLDRNGRISSWDVTMFDVNGKRRVERAPDKDAADEIAKSHLGRSIRPEAGSRGVAPLGRDELAVHGPYEKPREGSAAQRIIDRLNQARWSSVTDQGPKRGLTTAGDAPTLEYVRSILSDKGNPEAASIVREWISNKKNSDWSKRFDDSDLRPGETRADVIREIKEGAKRGRDYGEEGMTNLARTPASNVAFTQQPSLTRGGNVTADEVAEMARRSGNPTPGARQSRPPFTRDSHDSRDPSLDRAESAVPRSIMDKILPTAPGSKRVQISGMEERISELVKSGELTTDGAKAARAHAEEIVRMLKADKGSTTPIKAKGVTGFGVGNVGGTKQAKFDRTVNRAVGVAPHERAVVAGADPAEANEVLVGVSDHFDKLREDIARRARRGELTPTRAAAELRAIDREYQQAVKRANQVGEQDVVSARTVGLKEFDGNEYTRGNSTKTKLNALDRLLGDSKFGGPVHLPASYTSPREAALDLLQTVRPEGWEIDGLEKAIADRFRGAKWAEPGKAVRGEGAGPFDPPVRKPKTAAEPTPVEGEAPMTNPLPDGSSPVGVADEALTEVEDMGKTAAGRAGAKGAEALKQAGAKGGKPPRGRKPATTVPDDPRNFSPDEDAPLPPSQRRKGGVDPNFESEAGMLDGDAVDVRSPMTNPLPQGGSPVGLADDAVDGPGYPTPDDLLGDEVDMPAANPARDEFRRSVKEGLGAPSIGPSMETPRGFFPLPGNASQMDAAVAQRQALEAAEARKGREGAAADDSFLALENAAKQAAVENAARRAQDPNFYDSVDGADDFDPDSPVTDPSARPGAPNSAQRKWEQMTGNSQHAQIGVTDEVGPMGDMYGPSPPTPAQNIRIMLERFKKGEPAPPPPPAGDPVAQAPAQGEPLQPAALSASQSQIILDRLKSSGSEPPPGMTEKFHPGYQEFQDSFGKSASTSGPTPLQQAIERQAGGKPQTASAAPDPQTDEIRKASGDKSTPNNGPAPRVEAPPGPQQPLPTDSPGMIRRLAAMAGKAGVVGGLGAGAAYLAGQLGGRSYQPFPMAPQGGAGGQGGQGGQGGRPGMPPGLSPEDAMILEAELERAGRARNNGFQTSFHFGR